MTNVHIFSTEYLNSQEIHKDIARYFLSSRYVYQVDGAYLKPATTRIDWVLLNTPRKTYFGFKPHSCDIEYIIVIPFDIDGDPEKARIVCTIFFRLCYEHGLAPKLMPPLLNSGGGVHALLPIPQVKNTPATEWAIHELYKEYQALFEKAKQEAGIFNVKLDNCFDPARVFSMAGTRRVKDRTFTRHYFETPPDTVKRFEPLAHKISEKAKQYVPFTVQTQKREAFAPNIESMLIDLYTPILKNIYRQAKLGEKLNRDGEKDRSAIFAALVCTLMNVLRKEKKSRQYAEKIVYACRHTINELSNGDRAVKYYEDLERQIERLLEDFVWHGGALLRQKIEHTLPIKKERKVCMKSEVIDALSTFLSDRLYFLPGACVPKENVRQAFEKETGNTLSKMQFGQLTTGKQGKYTETIQNLQGKAVRCIQDHILLDVVFPTVEQGPELPSMKEVENVWLPVEWITPKHRLVFIIITLDFSVKNVIKLQEFDTSSMIFSLARAPPSSISIEVDK